MESTRNQKEVVYPYTRIACTLLAELRDMYKTRNFAALEGSLEELQQMFNRMEDALYDQKQFEKMCKQRKKLKREIKKLEEKRDDLQDMG